MYRLPVKRFDIAQPRLLVRSTFAVKRSTAAVLEYVRLGESVYKIALILLNNLFAALL